MRRTITASTIGFALMLAAAAAQADPDQALPGKMSDKIVNELAKADLDTLTADLNKFMGGKAGETIRSNFASVQKSLGASDFLELIYSRDYGKTEKDFIYKIDFANAFLFVRLLWQYHEGEWRLAHLTYKDAEDLPFPAGWEHIYPK